MTAQNDSDDGKAEAFLKNMEEEGEGFKNRDFVKTALAITIALERGTERQRDHAEEKFVICNGTLRDGYTITGPFPTEDEAFKYAELQFQFTKRWSIMKMERTHDK